MYKQVETDKEFVTKWGAIWHPVATLKCDRSDGKCQICMDDHCYVVFIGSDKDFYKPTSYIFMELLEFLKKLPKLSLCPPKFKHSFEIGGDNITPNEEDLWIS